MLRLWKGQFEVRDERLARDARANPAAFAELYQRHVRRVYRYLLVRAGGVQDAQDLTAQVFTTALKNLDSYRGDGPFAAWLMRIAHNAAVDFYRTRRAELPLEAFMEMPAVELSPDELVSQRLQLADILSALDELADDRAEVLRLRIFGGLSTAETAAVMGRSEAAVKMLLSRALADLKKRVARGAMMKGEHE